MTGSELREARIFMLRMQGGEKRPLRLLAAVSGGLDSMALLHFLLRWTAEHGGKVYAAHFNHRLRGEAADRDEAFVRDWCGANGVGFLRGEGDTRALAKHEGLSIEEAARKLRYGFLTRAAEAEHCQWVCTAHQAEDNAETVLLNLIRGSGSRGLSGIPMVRGNIARPFLRQTREELERYAAAWGIPHVEDETNADPDAAARNLLRQQVFPALRTLNPQAVRNMGRSAAIQGRLNALLDEEARALTAKAQAEGDALRIPRRALTEAHGAVAEFAVLALLEGVCGKRRDLTAVDAEAVLALCRGKEEKWELRLPHSVLARGEGEELVLALLPVPPPPRAIGPGRAVTFGEWTVTLGASPGPGYTYAVALPKGAALTVTPWRSGDRLRLPGSRGGRSLKRLCAEAGFRPWQRDALPVLRADERPAAAPGVGTDEAFVPGEGERGLYVTFYRSGGET